MKNLNRIKIGALVLGFLIQSSFIIAQTSGDTFESAKSSKSANLTYVYVGVNGFATKDASGNLSGLFVDIMDEFEKYVSSTYGISVNSTWQPIPDANFQKFLDEVKNGTGGVFGLNTTTIKEERKAFLKFSPAILNNISVLISHKSIPTLSSIDKIGAEFKSLSAYTAPGSTYQRRILGVKADQFPSLVVNNVDSEYDIINSVLENQKSFGFIDISFYLEYLNQRKPVKRHPVGDQGGEQYGIIMPKDTDWDTILAEFLNSGFLKSPKYRQMVIDNIGKGALRMLD